MLGIFLFVAEATFITFFLFPLFPLFTLLSSSFTLFLFSFFPFFLLYFSFWLSRLRHGDVIDVSYFPWNPVFGQDTAADGGDGIGVGGFGE